MIAALLRAAPPHAHRWPSLGPAAPPHRGSAAPIPAAAAAAAIAAPPPRRGSAVPLPSRHRRHVGTCCGAAGAIAAVAAALAPVPAISSGRTRARVSTRVWHKGGGRDSILRIPSLAMARPFQVERDAPRGEPGTCGRGRRRVSRARALTTASLVVRHHTVCTRPCIELRRPRARDTLQAATVAVAMPVTAVAMAMAVAMAAAQVVAGSVAAVEDGVHVVATPWGRAGYHAPRPRLRPPPLLGAGVRCQVVVFQVVFDGGFRAGMALGAPCAPRGHPARWRRAGVALGRRSSLVFAGRREWVVVGRVPL